MEKENKAPKVSVIIPVYNAEKYLRKCLDSVVNQKLKDIEIICINDGSTDSSLEVLQEYAAKDNRFVILTQENQGPAVARENGIKHAKSEYIGFVDSDDFIDKKYYQLLYKSAKKYDADIAVTDNVLLYDTNVVKKKKCGIPSKTKLILSNNEKSDIIITSGICWNKIYRKSFIDKNNLQYLGSHPGADNIFNATTVITANRIAVTHSAKYYYVQLPESIVHKLKTKKSFNIFNNYKYIDNWIDSQETLSLNDKEFWKYVNSRRKSRDFTVFYNTMQDEFREEFKNKADENLRIDNLIISLTSYPARIDTVNQTIESLFNQTVKAEKIILWLAPEQFPNREKDLPQQLLNLIPKGLIIDWYKDIKSYKKLIPTLQKYPDKVIITADDDIIYENDRIEKLYKAYLKNPEYIHCHRAHRMLFSKKKLLPYSKWQQKIKNVKPSYNNFFTGAGCILYPPKCFYKDILREDLFMELSPNADDIWFWAMAVMNNVNINVVKNNRVGLRIIGNTQNVSLWHENVLLGKNNKVLQNIFNYYPEVYKKLDSKLGYYSNPFEYIFSVKKIGENNVITAFGIKIKTKNKIKVYEDRLTLIEAKCNLFERRLELLEHGKGGKND